MRLPGIGAHHSARRQTDEWYTPPAITEALGLFDLDPCTDRRNWIGANNWYSIEDDGLDQPWEGRVWLNPPYSEVEPWMRRMAEHGHGTALVFARTETRWWFESVWPHASALLFLAGRVTFHRANGDRSKAGHNSGGPSVLIAYGHEDMTRLRACRLPGAFVDCPLVNQPSLA